MNCASIANKCGLSKKWVGGFDSNRRELALEVGDDSNYDIKKGKGLSIIKLEGMVWKSGKRG